MQLPYANLKLHHWNEGATSPLILPIHVICNTSDEEIYGNIRENSRNQTGWLKQSPAHDGTAVLCGSGPSIADFIGEIREHRAAGHAIFAMNGCARFLADHGIVPDYQVMIDARPQTADLIGPAKQHLFASQVSPECFKRAPTAKLWHLQVGNIENEFPEYQDDYCLIGGAASVGNTATCLAFAMGFRNLELYGYDSSHRGDAGHAFSQPMNAGDPLCVVRFGGEEYTASLTMKLQAEKFQETAQALISSGCRIEVHGDGLLPAMFRAPKEVLDEAAKYEQIWKHPEYREISPGEMAADRFIELCKPGKADLVIDFGCGTGRGGLAIANAGYRVLLMDFVDNSRDEKAKHLPFWKHDLVKPFHVMGDLGYCTDVMEHFPTEDVGTVVQNLLRAAPVVYFQISTIPDEMGGLIGHPLHLTVRPHEWWLSLFERNYHVRWHEAGAIASTFIVER